MADARNYKNIKPYTFFCGANSIENFLQDDEYHERSKDFHISVTHDIIFYQNSDGGNHRFGQLVNK